MKALDVIDALTRMGNTEGTGLVETPENENEIQDWIHDWFGGDCARIECDRDLKPNTKYVYSYDEKLWTLKGSHAEDCLIEVETIIAEDTTSHTNIYLYEVE